MLWTLKIRPFLLILEVNIRNLVLVSESCIELLAEMKKIKQPKPKSTTSQLKKIPQPSNQKKPCILQVHTPTLPFNLKAYLSLHLSFDSQNCVNISAKNICQTAQASTSHFKSSGRYVRNCIVLTHLIGFRAQLCIFLSLLQTDRLFSWEEGGSQSNVCQLVHKDAAVSAH